MDRLDAERLLANLGIPPHGQLRQAASYSNSVWIGRTVVVREAPNERPWTFAYEHQVLERLSPSVPHATLLHDGVLDGRPWVVLRRLPGRELGRAWLDLSISQRRQLIHHLGHILRALHTVELPLGWERPDLQAESLAARASALEIAEPVRCGRARSRRGPQAPPSRCDLRLYLDTQPRDRLRPDAINHEKTDLLPV